MPSPSTPHLRHTAPLAHTLSPLAAAVLLLACGSALAQGTPADTAAPKAQDDTTTSAMQSFTATRNHRFNDDWSVRNVTRAYDYRLDRYNTPPGGTTAPAAMTVGRTRAFILRDEKGVFNQTDVTWRNQLGGLKQEWLMGMELGQQKKRSESVSGGADRVSILNPSGAAPVIPTANYNADNAIPSHTTQDTAALY